MSIFDGFLSLGSKVLGSTDEAPTKEGVSSPLLPELELSKPDEGILAAIKGLETGWATFEGGLKNKRDRNYRYWKGTQSEEGIKEDALDYWEDKRSDNALFEATETFLAQATKTNPEPVVDSPAGEEQVMRFAKHLKDVLVYDADRSKLKLKVKRAARHQNLDYLGVVKFVWNQEEERIDVEAVRPSDLVMEKDTCIEAGVYKGDMLAQRRELTAKKLVEMFPKKKKFIEQMADKKMQTRLKFLEVWTNEYVCYRMEDEILGKSKNPHFNYEKQEIKGFDTEAGEVMMENTEPLNHFAIPRMPYLFLSIFNTGLHPVDDTTLFEQAIPYQRSIDKRTEQIDTNIDDVNNGYVGDPRHFNESTLQEAIQALRNGDAALCDPSALVKMGGDSLPQDVYNDLNDRRQRMKDVYGVSGFTPSGIRGEDTVRGKILTKGSDGDRIGSGVIEFIEQFYDSIFNYWAQMVYVYYQEEDLKRILGDEKAQEFLGLQTYMVNKELSISVKEGSLIPKDDLTKRNLAVDRWANNSIDPIEYMKALDEPDPEEAAYKLWLYQNNPQQYFSEFGGREIAQQVAPPAPTGGPGAQIPPETQVPGQEINTETPNLLENVPTQ